MAGQGGDAGPFGLGPGWFRCPAVVPGPGAGEQGVGAVDLVAGRAEVLPDRTEVGAAGDAVLHQPGGLRPVSVGGGAGVDAQLGLQRVTDGPGADEADQAAGKDRRLRPGRQANRQPTGGDMVDRAAPGVGGGDAVADQPLVQRQIRELALLHFRAGAHLSRWLAGRVATCGDRGCRARPGGGTWLPWDLGVGHRVAASGSDAAYCCRWRRVIRRRRPTLAQARLPRHLWPYGRSRDGPVRRAASPAEQAIRPPCAFLPARLAVPAAMSSSGRGGPEARRRNAAGPGSRSRCLRGWAVIVPPQGRAAHLPGRGTDRVHRAGRRG